MADRTPKAIPLAEAAELTSTGDLWLFRGKSPADRAIRLFTNSPVNHVAVALTLDDLPPLLWHAELGMSTEDVWAGEPQRGAQLHRLTEAVHTWVDKYGQRPYFRQLDTVVTTEMEDQFLRIEQGTGRAEFGSTEDRVEETHDVEDDWAIIIPAGVWHNVVNTGSEALKVYSLYSPPEHPDGTVHVTKAEADAAEAEHGH